MISCPEDIRKDTHRAQLDAVRKSPAYKAQVKALIEAHPICCICNTRSSTVVHHTNPEDYDDDLQVYGDFTRAKVIAICGKCHRAIHRGLELCKKCGSEWHRPGQESCRKCRPRKGLRVTFCKGCPDLIDGRCYEAREGHIRTGSPGKVHFGSTCEPKYLAACPKDLTLSELTARSLAWGRKTYRFGAVLIQEEAEA